MPGRTRIWSPAAALAAAAARVAKGAADVPAAASLPPTATHQVAPVAVTAGLARVRIVPDVVAPPSGSWITARTSYGVSGASHITLPAQRLFVMRVMFTPTVHVGAPWGRHSRCATALPLASPV